MKCADCGEVVTEAVKNSVVSRCCACGCYTFREDLVVRVCSHDDAPDGQPPDIGADVPGGGAV